MTKYSGHKVTAFGHGRVAKQGVAHRNTLYFAGGTIHKGSAVPPPSANNQRDIHPKFRTQPSGDTPANTWSDGREQPFFKATTATYLASPAQRFPGQAPVYAAQCPNPNAARFGEATGKNTSHDMYSRHQTNMTWSERIQRELTEADIGAAKVRALRKASEEGRRCTAEDVQVEMAAIAGGGGGGAEANGTLSGLGGSGLGTRGSRSSTAATGSRRFAHVGDDGGDDGRGVGVWGGGAPRSDDHSVEPVELDSYTPLIGANPPREGSRSNHYPRKNKRVQDLLPQHKEWRKTSAAECFNHDRDPNANSATSGTPGPAADGKPDWWEVPDGHQATLTNLKTKIFAKRNLTKGVEDNIETLKIKLRQKYNANQGAPTKRPTTADHVHKATEVRQREANKSKNKVPTPLNAYNVITTKGGAVPLKPKTISRDTDGTIRVLLKEPLKPAAVRAFRSLDKDGSGCLDRAEVVAGAATLLINEQQAGELFDGLDIDGDGTLSLEELTDLDPKSAAGRAQTAFAGTEHKSRRSLLTSAELHTWRVRDSFSRTGIRSPAPPTRAPTPGEDATARFDSTRKARTTYQANKTRDRASSAFDSRGKGAMGYYDGSSPRPSTSKTVLLLPEHLNHDRRPLAGTVKLRPKGGAHITSLHFGGGHELVNEVIPRPVVATHTRT